MILYPNRPHDHHLSTYLYLKHPPQVANYVMEDSFRRVLRINDKLFLIDIDYKDTSGSSAVVLTCLYPKKGKPNSQIVECIQNILGLNFDLNEFYEIMEKNKLTRSLKSSLFGLKLMRSASFYEALIEAITEQQISYRAAITIRKRLAKRFSEKITYEDKEYVEFPPSKMLALAEVEELKALGLNTNKAKAIIAVSQLEVDGKLYRLCNSSISEIFFEFINIKGIGKWTIQYALSRGLGYYNTYPEKDYALKMGMKKLFGGSEFKTDEEIKQFFSKFGKYSGYLAFYIVYSFVFSYEEHKKLPKKTT